MIEKRRVRDVAYRVIIGGLHSDHASIARFRAKHEQALGGLFSQVLRRLAAEGMVSLGTLSLDGTKLAGNAAQKADKTLQRGELRPRRPGQAPVARAAGQRSRPARPPPSEEGQAPGPVPGHRPCHPPHAASRGREDYKLRARTVEPVFGQLKTCQKLSAMSQRGLTACESEWLLACTAHNLRKLHRYRLQG